MNKRIIVNWLKAEQERALAAVKTQYDLTVEQTWNNLWAEVNLSEVAANLQKTIDDFHEQAVKFEETLKAAEGITMPMYSTLSQKVYDLTKSKTAVEQYIKDRAVHRDQSPRFQRLQKQRRDLENGIRANYTTAIENVKTLKDSKAAMEYLAGLGFDLTELKKLDEPKETTAIMLPVDPRYLFIGDRRGDKVES